MIERTYRKFMERFPLAPGNSIPFYRLPQTEILSILSVVLRFGSVLTAAAVVAVFQGVASQNVLLMVAPAALADRSAVILTRIRRS
ncbi:hypothetical protein GCM10010371_68110 [Streptomyces subrutilus]|uniref:Uncharacterized protein n=1 Tax=Streptomyces subrutilus TaxID=36818 RepID=A0A918VHW3_9ACTN|nr:hypothetical protein [Streptomyces subrutilus]GGZ98941.1 hypothetical protein GCM10010371_68110 [Streptomyces subrutilus]